MTKRGFTYVCFLLLFGADGERNSGPPRAKAGAQTYLAEVGEFDRVPGRASAPRAYEPMPGIKGFYYQTKQADGVTYVRLKSTKWAYIFDYKINTSDIAVAGEKALYSDLCVSIAASDPANGTNPAIKAVRATVKAKSGARKAGLPQSINVHSAPLSVPPPCNPVSSSVNFEWKNFKSDPINITTAMTEVLSKCKDWKSCNASVEIAIRSPWKKRAHGDPFKPHKNWGYRPPYAVMIDRAKWIQNVMIKYGKVPATAFLPFKIDFDAGGMQKTHIKFK